MANVVIIPARSGSTRVTHKNIRFFHGLSMLERTIREVRRAGGIDRIIVSTDSPAYREIAISSLAEVPSLRIAELAGDSVSTIDVVVDSILRNEVHQLDNVCCVYPTNPLLDSRLIDLGLTILSRTLEPCYVTPVVSFGFPPQRSLRHKNEIFLSMFEPQNMYTRSQDLDPVYHETSQFWWARASTWLSRIHMQELISPIYIKEWMQQDIDDEDDLILADAKYSFKLDNQELWDNEISKVLKTYL